MSRIAVYAGLSIVTISSLYPFFLMFINSFKSMGEYFANPYGLPRDWTLSSFQLMFNTMDPLRALLNSTIVVVLGVLLNLLVASMAAYSLTKLRPPGYRFLFVSILSAMMVPFQVILVPLFVNMAHLGWVNTFQVVVLLYVATSCPFGVYLMRSYYAGVQDELIEAAQMDGLSYHGIFTRIMIPVARPALVTLGVINFVQMWTNLLIALVFLQQQGTRTITVGIALLTGQRLTNYPAMFALLLIGSVPTVICFLLFQRHLASGVLVGVEH
ncbi:MAG TPA: carbohydrate ABC transporter permease [bacterium]|nr:carbohydrate ABC transporter permease [bacterium]